MSQPKVLVTHMGARHNYALPAAFADAGMLEGFYTDMCGGRGIGRLAGLASSLPLPSALGNLARGLAGRVPPANVLSRTRTFDLAALPYEIKARRIADPRARRPLLFDLFHESGRIMAGWGLGEATHLFNVFGLGGQLVRQANDKGIPVLADMIIALSTRQIALDEYRAYPDWGPPPADPPYSEMDGFNPDAEMLETTDVFVCPSAFVADDLVDNWGVEREATRIIPYALRSDWFDLQPQTIPGRVLFVGSAERRKGIHYLAFAARELPQELELRVAGHVSEDIRTRSETERLTFLGRVPREEVKREFAEADVFVLPSLAEGSATVIYEAMAAGLPVVTTKAAGSVIQHGVDGLIVPERDPDALARAIEKIVGDRALRDKMSLAARRNARHWSWQTYAGSLCELVRETPSPLARR